MQGLTPHELISFEEEIANLFAQGKIRSPIHLSGGNEQQLIDIFSKIKDGDYVLSSWRSHYHCLLRGVPRDKLKAAILAGRSVSLCFPEHKILCSGIVGGIAPIAVGIAWSFKRRADMSPNGHESVVHCFLGDMSAESGIVHEAMKYGAGHDLPIRWIVEDNGISVCTDTKKSWGDSRNTLPDITNYQYSLSRPHAGIGKWIRF
jgi:TPP-dependent pyruvate/acetoin dehydrogenase alpha subunit